MNKYVVEFWIGRPHGLPRYSCIAYGWTRHDAVCEARINDPNYLELETFNEPVFWDATEVSRDA